MKELSLHILDLVENSLKANATLIELNINEDIDNDLLSVSITDNGYGMEKEILDKATDPFMTTRKTRDVGLGISLTKAASERCEGIFRIESEINVGTEVLFTFRHSHIDRAPLGNMGQTIMTIINQSIISEILYKHSYKNNVFIFDTREIKEVLDGVNIKSPKVLLWIEDYINENIKNLYVK